MSTYYVLGRSARDRGSRHPLLQVANRSERCSDLPRETQLVEVELGFERLKGQALDLQSFKLD